MIKLLWIQKNTPERPEEESLRISDALKIDYFWGFPEPQILKPLGDRLHTQNHTIILDYLNLSKISVDKITQFGLRTPELS